MATAIGQFDEGLVTTGMFDASAALAGWFDTDLLAEGGIAGVNVTAALGEIDVSGLPAQVTYTYATVTVTAVPGEVDIAGLAARATVVTPVTVIAALGEIDIAGLAASAIVSPLPQSLTIGRVYPLPPGNRLYPILPTGRNTIVG